MIRLLTAALLSLGLAASAAAAPANPVAEALAAMGGEAAAQIRTIRISGTTTFHDPEQSFVPGGEPIFGAASQFVQTRDLTSGRMRADWKADAQRPAPHAHAYTEVIADGIGYVKGVDSFLAVKRSRETGEHRMSTMRVIAMTRELERLSPRLLVEMQAHPDRVTPVKGQRLGGRPAPAVLYRGATANFTVVFDPASKLPAILRTTDYDPMRGDQPFEVALSDWRSAGPVRYPYKQTHTIGGGLVAQTTVASVAINPEIDAQAFAIPDALRALPAGKPPEVIPYQWILRKQGFNVFLDGDAVGYDPDLPGPVITDLAPGVSFQTGGGYNTLIVELKDYLVLYDAAYELQSKWLLERLKEKYPGKPVRYVVLSHRHFDHAGGLRTYVAAGATVVVGKGGGAYLRKALTSPATLAGVPLPARLSPKVEEVDGRWAVTDGERTAEAYTFANPHAEDLVLGYVPHARMGFVSDIWSPGREPVRDPLQPGLKAVADGVAQWKLKPERFAGGHGAVGPYAPLAAAAGQ